MRISSFFYTLRQGVRNLFRNKWFTLASIATISACLFLFGLFYAIVTNFQHIVKTAEEGVSVTVFFDEGLEESRIQAIGLFRPRRPGNPSNRSIWVNMQTGLRRIRWPTLPIMRFI